MDIIKYIFKKIGDGFLLGIGISGTIMLATVISSQMLIESMEDEFDYGHTEFSPDVKLIIAEETLHPIDESSFNIIGVIKNNSDGIWGNVQIEVELLDSEGKLIDEFSEYIESTLKPEAMENFKVAISYYDGMRIPEYDHYTIRIVDASAKKNDK
jgi:hypothetical protein